MEKSRRMLRNKSNCHQIHNIFNIKTIPTPITNHLPPQILNKIGKLQKISCSNIHDLPELHPHQQFQLEIQQCRLAQDLQMLTFHESIQKVQVKAEQAMESQQHMQNTLKQGLITQQGIQAKSEEERRWANNFMEQESKGYDIWKDGQFLSRLNDLVMFGSHDNKLSIADQLLQK